MSSWYQLCRHCRHRSLSNLQCLSWQYDRLELSFRERQLLLSHMQIANGSARPRAVTCDCKRFNMWETNFDMQLALIGVITWSPQTTSGSCASLFHPHNIWIAWKLPREYVSSKILPWPYWPYSLMRSVDRNVSFYPIIATLIWWLSGLHRGFVSPTISPMSQIRGDYGYAENQFMLIRS